MAVDSATHFTLLHNHSWNIFRYTGDFLHLTGIVVLLATLAKNRACTGVSRSTHVLRFGVFATRYLDLLDHNQTEYLVFFKLTYIITSIMVLIAFWRLNTTYEPKKDTCSVLVMFLISVTGALLLTDEYNMLNLCWTFSQFLAGFAMVPQYVFCYRDVEARDMGVAFYVVSLGGYRLFYAANWIYKKILLPQYSDMTSWIGGVIEIGFFFDFLSFRFTGHSILRKLTLKVDDKVNEIKEKVEEKVKEVGVSFNKKAVSVASETGMELRKRRGGGKSDAAAEEVMTI